MRDDPYWEDLRAGKSHQLHIVRARRLFFRAIDYIQPKVQRTLREEVLPKFQEMLAELRNAGRCGPAGSKPIEALHYLLDLDSDPGPNGPFLFSIEPWVSCCMYQEPRLLFEWFYKWYSSSCGRGEPAVEPLQQALDAWANKFNLSVPWVKATALNTMWTWEGAYYDHKPKANWIIPEPVDRGSQHLDEDEGYVELPDLYDLTVRTLGDLRKEYTAAFKEMLDARLRKLEGLAKKRGIPIAKRGGTPAHFKWVVRFQVCDDPVLKIATDTKKSRKTVKEAIEGLLEFLDLPERPRSKRGPARR
jgi:hypothetical protein